MKGWVILALLLIFLSYPVSVVAEETQDSGKNSNFGLPVFKIPLGSTQNSSSASDKKGESETYTEKKQKQKEIEDKKVDDAIKKAWEEK